MVVVVVVDVVVVVVVIVVVVLVEVGVVIVVVVMVLVVVGIIAVVVVEVGVVVGVLILIVVETLIDVGLIVVDGGASVAKIIATVSCVETLDRFMEEEVVVGVVVGVNDLVVVVVFVVWIVNAVVVTNIAVVVSEHSSSRIPLKHWPSCSELFTLIVTVRLSSINASVCMKVQTFSTSSHALSISVHFESNG